MKKFESEDMKWNCKNSSLLHCHSSVFDDIDHSGFFEESFLLSRMPARILKNVNTMQV